MNTTSQEDDPDLHMDATKRWESRINSEASALSFWHSLCGAALLEDEQTITRKVDRHRAIGPSEGQQTNNGYLRRQEPRWLSDET